MSVFSVSEYGHICMPHITVETVILMGMASHRGELHGISAGPQRTPSSSGLLEDTSSVGKDLGALIDLFYGSAPQKAYALLSA